MTTLVSLHTSEGEVGRCDAKCYNAEHPSCHCICGGMNHSVGVHQAMENTQEMGEQWIEAYADRKQMDEYQASVNGACQQMAFDFVGVGR